MKKKDFLPILMGSDENVYGNVRLITEAYGVKPLVLCTGQLIPTVGSHLFTMRIIRDFDTDAVFVPTMDQILTEAEKEYEKTVLIPCSDYYLRLTVKHYDSFRGRVANRFISCALLDELDTKHRFYALCEKYGLDYPKTLVASPEERTTVLDGGGLRFPIVVKPENSNAAEYLHCHFEGKKKVFFFDDRASYDKVIVAMNGSDYRGRLILQEFIPGGDDAMRVVNCYSGLDGRVKLACLGQPVLEEYSPATLGNYAAIVSRSDRSITERIAGFLDELHYVGFSNFDMKYDKRTGKYMLFEINNRTGRSSFFVYAAGENLMKYMIDDAVYGKAPAETVHTGKTALWTAIPRGVLFRYVKDPALKKELKVLWKKKPVRTLFHCRDLIRSPARFLAVHRYYLSYYKSFRRYWFDKEEKKEGEPGS